MRGPLSLCFSSHAWEDACTFKLLSMGPVPICMHGVSHSFPALRVNTTGVCLAIHHPCTGFLFSVWDTLQPPLPPIGGQSLTDTLVAEWFALDANSSQFVLWESCPIVDQFKHVAAALFREEIPGPTVTGLYLITANNSFWRKEELFPTLTLHFQARKDGAFMIFKRYFPADCWPGISLSNAEPEKEPMVISGRLRKMASQQEEYSNVPGGRGKAVSFWETHWLTIIEEGADSLVPESSLQPCDGRMAKFLAAPADPRTMRLR